MSYHVGNPDCLFFHGKAHYHHFIAASTTLNFELCRKLDSFLGPRLSTLASDIGEQYSKRPQTG